MRLFVGVLCIALVLVGSTLQVAHTHPGGDLSHTGCSLCATAHAVADMTAQPMALPALPVSASIQTFTELPRPTPLATFALFTRPPPAASTLA